MTKLPLVAQERPKHQPNTGATNKSNCERRGHDSGHGLDLGMGMGVAGMGVAGMGVAGMGVAGMGVAGMGMAGMGMAGMGTAGLVSLSPSPRFPHIAA